MRIDQYHDNTLDDRDENERYFYDGHSGTSHLVDHERAPGVAEESCV